MGTPKCARHADNRQSLFHVERVVRANRQPQHRSNDATQANPAPSSTKMLAGTMAEALPDNGLNTANQKPITSSTTSAATSIHGNHRGMTTTGRLAEGNADTDWLAVSLCIVGSAGSPRISTPTPYPGRRTGDCPFLSSSKLPKPLPNPEVAMSPVAFELQRLRSIHFVGISHTPKAN